MSQGPPAWSWSGSGSGSGVGSRSRSGSGSDHRGALWDTLKCCSGWCSLVCVRHTCLLPAVTWTHSKSCRWDEHVKEEQKEYFYQMLLYTQILLLYDIILHCTVRYTWVGYWWHTVVPCTVYFLCFITPCAPVYFCIILTNTEYHLDDIMSRTTTPLQYELKYYRFSPLCTSCVQMTEHRFKHKHTATHTCIKETSSQRYEFTHVKHLL